VKSVSRGRRDKRRVVERKEEGRGTRERRGEEKRKKKKKASALPYLIGMIWFIHYLEHPPSLIWLLSFLILFFI
jgi:hypothetical protein